MAAFALASISCSAPQSSGSDHIAATSVAAHHDPPGMPPTRDVIVNWSGHDTATARSFATGENPSVNVSFTNRDSAARTWTFDLIIVPTDRYIGGSPKASDFPDRVWALSDDASETKRSITVGPFGSGNATLVWPRRNRSGAAAAVGRYGAIMPIWQGGHVVTLGTGWIAIT